MTTGEREDPYLAFNFVVREKGEAIAGFTEVTGLQAEMEVQEYREGGQNDYIHRLAGPARYPSNLVFKRGLADGDKLWSWYQAAVTGPAGSQRKALSIVLQDTAGAAVWTWNVTDALPVKWLGPDLRANASEVAVESLELVHRGISKA